MEARLAVISDEVSQEPDVLAAFCGSFRLPVDVELRSITFRGHEYKSPFELGRQAAEELNILFQNADVSVIGLASPLLKCDWTDEEEIQNHLAGFRHCLDLCSVFGCKLVRGFAFWGVDNEAKADGARDKASQLYDEYLLPEAEAAGVTIVMENEASTTLSTARKTAAFVGRIDSPNIRIVWDPANEVYAKDGIRPYPEAWELVRPFAVHVHAKDAVLTPDNEAETVEFGTGIIDWPGQLRALVDMDYHGIISLETHWRMGEEALSRAVTDQPGGADFTTAAAEESSRICMDRLLDMLAEAMTAPRRE